MTIIVLDNTDICYIIYLDNWYYLFNIILGKKVN